MHVKDLPIDSRFNHIKHGAGCCRNRMPVYECETCQKQFDRPGHLERHLQRKKPCTPPGDDDHEEYPCDKCNGTFRHQSSLSRHRKYCKGPKLTAEQIIADLTNQLKAAQDSLAADRGEAEQAVEPAKDEEVTIVSCCTIMAEDVFKPSVYFGRPGPLLIPEIEVLGQIIKLGESHDVPERINKQHVPDFGGFTLLDCIKAIDPVLIEQRLKKLLKMEGRLIKCKAANKAYKDTEVFVVKSQEEYNEIVLRCKNLAEQHAFEVVTLNKEMVEARSAKKEAEVNELKEQIEYYRSQVESSTMSN